MRVDVFACAVLLVALAVGALAMITDQRIRDTEYIVRKVASDATALYGSKRAEVASCSCSLHACGSTFPGGPPCSPKLDKPGNCRGCDVPGRRADIERSVIITPPGTDADDLGGHTTESICIFRDLDESFVEQVPEGGYTWVYIATTSGVMRFWPGVARERDLENGTSDGTLGKCRQYDPRGRPWFIAASSGPKDVIIVLDASESMSDILGSSGKTRWQVAKNAASRLLDTFNFADYVSIVTFNNMASVLGQAHLSLANSTNVEELRIALDSVTPLGGTDFRESFKLAFDVFVESAMEAEATDRARTSSCTKVVIHLSDGDDCSVNKQLKCQERGGPAAVVEYIASRQAELEALGSTRAHVFTFSMTSEADDKLPKMIACENEGSWNHIGENDDPLFKFLDYVRFLAWGRKGEDVAWSNPYLDDYGLGNITTASIAVYAPDVEGVPGLLVGVVGKDVVLSSLMEEEEEFTDGIQRIANRGFQCRPLELNNCQLQVLRGEEAECPDKFTKNFTCYVHFLASESKFYRTDPESKLAFADAQAACSASGGRLVEIESENEHRFLSGLATINGSWIGLRLSTEDIIYKWRWVESGKEVNTTWSSDPDADDIFWASRMQETGQCAAIDRRGLRTNVFEAGCKANMTFICEYTAPPQECLDGEDLNPNITVRIDSTYDPTVPPISSCADFKRAEVASTQVVEGAESISAGDVLCPLGEDERTTEELQCCCT